MLATVTEKGQVTVPKKIRELIGIEPGCLLDFEVMEDGCLRVRVMPHGAEPLFGLLQQPGCSPRNIEAMDDGIAEAVTERHWRSQR